MTCWRTERAGEGGTTCLCTGPGTLTSAPSLLQFPARWSSSDGTLDQRSGCNSGCVCSAGGQGLCQSAVEAKTGTEEARQKLDF